MSRIYTQKHPDVLPRESVVGHNNIGSLIKLDEIEHCDHPATDTNCFLLCIHQDMHVYSPQ